MSIRYLLAVALLATGCVGTLQPAADDVVADDDDMPPGMARQKFETDVYPILNAKCGGCHKSTAQNATPFVGTTVANGYVAAIGFQVVVGNFTETGAPLINKIIPGPHNSVTYTSTEKTAILDWFALELTERGGGTIPPVEETPAAATARIISEWSGCLKDTDFTALNFGITWANKGSNEGNCEQCHTSGAYGMQATDDNLAMYEVLSTSKTYMMAYFQADLTDLANPKMIPNFKNFQRVGLRQIPHQEHPSFNTQPDDAAFAVLQTLYDTTMGYKTAGTCGPPRIPR
jgi:mono/diheme cytochrome c family protein